MPHELTIDEIHELVEKFGDCAFRAQKAGFDGIELHGAHGYLISQFMSSYSNKRVDEYGGSILNRMHFPLEIIANIRAKVGKDFPIIFRISADEFVTGGRTIEDTKVIARFLENAGIDAINIDQPHVISAHDVLAGKADAGRRVLVIGGGMVGAETAQHLANHGKEVSIVEALSEIAVDEEREIRNMLLQDLRERNVRIYVNSVVKEILEDGVLALVNGKEEIIGPVDTVVFAMGLRSENELSARLENQVEKVITVGDAVEVRKALEAIKEGFRAGLEI